MTKRLSFLATTLSFCALLAAPVTAQPLPKIQLTPAFPALKLVRPLWMSESPDGTSRLFIVEQQGRILIVKKGSDGADSKEFFNIVDRKPYVDNEEGLLSIAFHPGYKTNGLIYVYYNGHNPRRSIISEFKVSATDPDKIDMASERILLEVPQPFSNHNGGELAFGPDGYLYLALGDGGDGYDPNGNGQNTAALLAKILRFDLSTRATAPSGGFGQRKPLQYGYPADNPFVNEPEMNGRGARKEIFAYGLRNVWRYSFDKQTGDLWAADVGQDLWEEVDLIVKGGDYGWSAKEATHYFKPSAPGAQFIDPVMEYPHKAELMSKGKFPDHSIGMSITGGYVYRGKKYPALQGVYVYGDYVLGSIWGFRYENGKVTQSGSLLPQNTRTLASFAEDADGEIYAISQDLGVMSISVAQ